MEKIERLEYLLNISKEYSFIENSEGDSILKIKGYYETDKKIYINFTKLITLLKENNSYDKVLSDMEN